MVSETWTAARPDDRHAGLSEFFAEGLKTDRRLVTLVWDVTVLERGLGRIEQHFRRGPVPVAYRDGDREIVTDRIARGLSYNNLAAKVLYGGPVNEEARQGRFRYWCDASEADLEKVDLPVGARLAVAEVMLAKTLPAVAPTHIPAVVILHFICDDEDSATSLIGTYVRERGAYGDLLGPTGPEVVLGRERLAYQLSSATDLFAGVLFAVVDDAILGQLAREVTVTEMFARGEVRRPYTVASFPRTEAAESDRSELLREARRAVSGQKVAHAGRNVERATSATLASDATHLHDLSGDWSVFVGRDGMGFGFRSEVGDQAGFVRVGQVYAHTIYTDGVALVRLGARLAHQLAVSASTLNWDENYDLRLTSLLDASLEQVEAVYMPGRATSSSKLNGVIDALRAQSGERESIEDSSRLIAAMNRIGIQRAAIATEHDQKVKNSLLGVLSFGVVPAALAERISDSIDIGHGDLGKLVVWLAVSTLLALIIWGSVKAVRKLDPAAAQVKKKMQVSSIDEFKRGA